VIFHEAGHFTFAKIFKARVEKFYLFFDPWFSIFKIKKGETEYGVGWIPLGGYVKISGMIDESMDKEQLKLEPQPWEFRSKPAWQRLLIMLGGVMVNFLLAIFIYIFMLFIKGDDYLPVSELKYGIVTDSLGREFGLRDGDKILRVNNKEIENYNDVLPEILLNQPRTLQLERNGQPIEITFTNEDLAQILDNKQMKSALISPRIPFIIAQFPKKSNAQKAGLLPADKLIGVDSSKINYFDEYVKYFQSHKNQTVNLNVLRSEDTVSIPVAVDENGLIGVEVKRIELFKLRHTDYSFFAAIPAGVVKGYEETSNYLKQFKLIFNPETKAYNSLGSFVTIGKLFSPQWDWNVFWRMTALLSIMLGVVNLLPIPALDGGHAMFTLFEIITRRKPSDKFMEYAQITGMVLLLALMVFALKNDIVNNFF
jgi:regulator of sigma E protease